MLFVIIKETGEQEVKERAQHDLIASRIPVHSSTSRSLSIIFAYFMVCTCVKFFAVGEKFLERERERENNVLIRIYP